MQKFTTLSGVAAPMDRINIDTDQIIPKLHLRTIKRTGLGKFAFEEARYDVDGNENPDFILNQDPYRKAQIIVAGDNFGCGSSREHAPTSFGDIFFNNSMKNGLVPIRVSREELDALMADAKDAENPELTIDLEKQEIRRPNGPVIKFDFDEFRRHCLLNGLDDIGLTLQKDDAISDFESKRKQELDWLETGTGV